MPTAQAATAAPSDPRPSDIDLTPFCAAHRASGNLADRLAWENDRGDFTGDYPGPGWDAPRYEPDPDDARMLAERHGADHDAAPGDEEDFHVASMPDADWWAGIGEEAVGGPPGPAEGRGSPVASTH